MKQKTNQSNSIKWVAVFVMLALFIVGCKNQSGKINTAADGQKNIQDDTLKGFLLAGVYFVQGYGGTEKFIGKIKSSIDIDSNKAEFLPLLDSAYHQNFIYPYPRSVAEKVDARNTLSSWFEINDQNDFYMFLANLKDSGYQAHYLLCKKVLDENGGAKANVPSIDLKKYDLPEGSGLLLSFVKDNYSQFSKSGIKAWDMGLYVYAVCLGYGAEYIDAQNGKLVIVQMLKSAQKAYPDWKTYFNDFMLGRKFAGTDPSANATYQQVIDAMLEGTYSMYSYLPLN